MSVLTHLILVTWSDEPDSVMERVQAFSWDGRMLNLQKIDRHQAGGTKVFCYDLYFGCFNHLPVDELTTYLKGIDWADPSYVQLLIEHEDFEDNAFRTIKLFENQ